MVIGNWPWACIRTCGFAVARDSELGRTCFGGFEMDERRSRVFVHPVSKMELLGGVIGLTFGVI